MKRNSAKQNEYQNFSNALGKVLKVSHAEMQARLAAEKKEKPSVKRASSVVRASGGKD